MARRKSAWVALKKLEKSYEEDRKRLLQKAQDEMAANVDKIVAGLLEIAKDFPAVVSKAVAPLVSLASPKAEPAARAAKQPPAKDNGQDAERFRAIGVKAHRAKLGLSADNYGKLVGVSGVTIYKWETGKNKPQAAQKAKWLAIRGMGKEEATRRLGTATPKAPPAATAKSAAAKPAAPAKRKRGTFKQTAEELVLAVLAKKPATTKELTAAWKKSGRGGRVDNVLSKMVKDKKLTRKPLDEGGGSEYRVA